jgi:hypothetical protein
MTGASVWGIAHGAAVLDVVAGDTLVLQVDPSGAAATFTGSRSWLELVPVGGSKGDQGVPGPSGGPVPTGGVAPQVLTKLSSTDGDAGWRDGPNERGAIYWHTPVLLNGWTNFGGFVPASYGRRHGQLYCRGLLNNAAATAQAANLFGVTTGYKPSQVGAQLSWVPGGGGNQLVRLDIQTSGMLQTSAQTGSGGANAGWLSLTGVLYPLEVLNGIEGGFEATYAGGIVSYAAGQVWVDGVLYDVPAGTLAVAAPGAGQYRVVAVGSFLGIQLGSFVGANPLQALANFYGNGWGGRTPTDAVSMIGYVTGAAPGTFVQAREWV